MKKTQQKEIENVTNITGVRQIELWRRDDLQHPRLDEVAEEVHVALVYNGILVIAVAQSAWQFLSRVLPPVASSISVMMIPILGVFSGAWLLNEKLLWQDWTAVALIVLSVLLVLAPAKPAQADEAAKA